MEIIPIVHCFDNNYVLPAGVAFYSLLEKSNPNYYYKIYVLHNDITKENQEKLKESITVFKNGEIIFKNMENRFQEEWKELKFKGYYSKEMFYKLFIPSIFNEYDKVIVSDVDVIYLDDISFEYNKFDVNDDYYIAGINIINTQETKKYYEEAYRKFSKEEKKKLVCAAGYFILNAKKCREEKIEEKFVRCFIENKGRLKQAEQDILNLCCYPKIKELPIRNLVCTYMYNKGAYDYIKDETILIEIEKAKKFPVQLHYATPIKPWKNLGIPKADEWVKVLAKTIFLNEYLKQIQEKISIIDNKRKILKINIPYKKNKRISVELNKEKI
ncbi:MAG: glycosyltransferase family 8 protein [Fusobacterium mortiferum]